MGCGCGQSSGWWKRSTVGKQSLLAQHEFYGLSTLPMLIASWWIASRKVVECGCDQSHGREILWNSNLCRYSTSFMSPVMCQLRLLPGSERDGRGKRRIPLRKVDATVLKPGGREVLWVNNICWHTLSPMASAMIPSC